MDSSAVIGIEIYVKFVEENYYSMVNFLEEGGGKTIFFI